MLPAISCAASWATVRRRPSWRARPTSRTGSWLAWSILESGRGKSPPSRSPCAGDGAPFLGGRPNREPISSELGLCCAAVRRGYWLRVDLDDLRRAGGLARHAVDAVRLPDHVGLVASILVPLLAAFLNDLVVSRAFLARGEKPLEDVDGADVHADAVGDAAVEVDGLMFSPFFETYFGERTVPRSWQSASDLGRVRSTAAAGRGGVRL